MLHSLVEKSQLLWLTLRAMSHSLLLFHNSMSLSHFNHWFTTEKVRQKCKQCRNRKRAKALHNPILPVRLQICVKPRFKKSFIIHRKVVECEIMTCRLAKDTLFPEQAATLFSAKFTKRLDVDECGAKVLKQMAEISWWVPYTSGIDGLNLLIWRNSSRIWEKLASRSLSD